MPMERKRLSVEEKDFKKKTNRWLKFRSDASDLKNGFGKAPKCNTREKIVAAPIVDTKKKKK